MKKLLAIAVFFFAATMIHAQDLKNGFWKYDGSKTDNNVVIKAFDYQEGDGVLYVFQYEGKFIKKYGSGKLYFENDWIKLRVDSGYGIHKKKDLITHLFRYEIVDDNTLLLTDTKGNKLTYKRSCE